MTPQLVVLSKHLKTHKTISQAEAGLVYKIRALPKRISELKQLGYKITRELKQDPTGQRYARYTLVSEPLFLEDKSEQKSSGGLVTSNAVPKVGDRVVVTKPFPGWGYEAGAQGVVEEESIFKGDYNVRFDAGFTEYVDKAEGLKVIVNV
jgi:hypothetical protein